MMLGKVAPAPLSFTWAVAGATTARVAASASSGDFVIVGASSGLERELHLEQPARPRGVLDGRRCAFIRQVVDVREHSEVGRDLIGDAADDASLPIATYARVGIDDVDAGDQRDAAALDVVHAERTNHAPGGLGNGRCRDRVFRGRVLTGDRKLL